MKNISVLICLMLASMAAPAFAHHMTNDCAAQAAKIANTEERIAFEKFCLKEVATEETETAEQHDKEEHCDTNAKSMKLTGKNKIDYLDHCYHESDFAPNQKPHPKAAK